MKRTAAAILIALGLIAAGAGTATAASASTGTTHGAVHVLPRLMFFYPSDAEGLAWLEAPDASWAARAVSAYEAAVERGPDEIPADETC